MSSRIIRRPKFIRDVTREWVYLTESAGSQVAERWLTALEETANLLLSTPGIGTPCHFEGLNIAKVRRFRITLPFGKWLVFYSPTRNGINLLRVVHGARHPAAFRP